MTENRNSRTVVFHIVAVTATVIVGIICGICGILYQTAMHKKELIPLNNHDLQIAQAYCNDEIESFNPLTKMYICKDDKDYKFIYIDDAMTLMSYAEHPEHSSRLEYLRLIANPHLAKPSKTPEQEYAEKLAERAKVVAFVEQACKDHLGFQHRRMTKNFALCTDGYYVAHSGSVLNQDMIENNLDIDMDIAKGIKPKAVHD